MKKTTTLRLWLMTIAALLLTSSVWAQLQTPLDIALRHVEQNKTTWNLTDTDITDMAVSDQYVTKHNGVTHIYFIQRWDGLEIYNAIMGVHLTADGKVGYVANRFLPEIQGKVNTTVPILQPYEALQAAAQYLDLEISQPLRLLSQVGDRQYTYQGGSIAHNDITVKLMFQPNHETGAIRLAWGMDINVMNHSDYWSLRIDAETGALLDQNNYTVYCSFSKDANHTHDANCSADKVVKKPAFKPVEQVLIGQNRIMNDSAKYNVFPVPVESPIHGERELVVDPHDPTASPEGWHGVSNVLGYTITRGNNVHAFLDLDNSNESAGDEPDGGEELVFDFPFDDEAQEPADYQKAAVTQLFYMNNIMHDFTYSYGFDEAAGNFQQNNFNLGGNGGDPVNAHAQDGGGTNNANFGTPPDGANGTMQMYLWDQAGGRILTVNAPEGVEGQQFEATPGQFGAPITADPVSGEVVIVDDGTGQPTLGCETLTNDLTGKIALIDRGVCEFGLKSLNAEQAGAVAVIVCNFEEAMVNMAAGAVGDQVTIPAVFMRNSDCAAIRVFVDDGLAVTLQLPGAGSGPQQLDGDFDNGIIAHEYGHGISNRLTGGPGNAGCLNNGEQMGEGWSDFFTLITTVEPGDNGDMVRGVGAYVLREEEDGRGIRRQPYSTDPGVNDQTYHDVIGQGVHATGEIWAATLWDLYWKFVEVYGWDEDQYHGTGGNNIAVQLVMDGMKLQNCNPGFLDGREGILAADILNNDGVNQCLIWEVFARRGLGWSAEQGSSFTNNDGIEGYDVMPGCIKELSLEKSVTELINAGDEITITLEVNNYKDEMVTGVVITDEILDGTAYVPGSVSGLPNADASADMITFQLGDIPSQGSKTISYRVTTNPNWKSVRQFYDDVEDGDTNWFIEALDETGTGIWDLSTDNANSGEYSWFVPNTEFINDQIVQILEPIAVTGEQPVLRFYHNYDITPGTDGGFVQISKNGGVNWDDVGAQFFKNGYQRPLAYTTIPVPNLQAFSGAVGDFVDSYIDLSPYQGEEISVRFRFGSNEGGAATGWYVDDIEFMDMFNYSGEACITSNEGDNTCVVAPHRGTIVETGEIVSTDEPDLKSSLVEVYPNPTSDILNVAISTKLAEKVSIDITTLEGKVLFQSQQDINSDFELIPINVSTLASGFYFVRVSTEEEIVVKKVIIE